MGQSVLVSINALQQQPSAYVLYIHCIDRSTTAQNPQTYFKTTDPKNYKLIAFRGNVTGFEYQ